MSFIFGPSYAMVLVLKPAAGEGTETMRIPDGALSRRWQTLFLLAIVVAGLLNASPFGHGHMEEDGIPYLDMAVAYQHHNWAASLNSYWSPLYTWLLGLVFYIFKPRPYWEQTAANFLNFVIFLWALLGLEFLLVSIRKLRQTAASSQQDAIVLPEWALQCLAYTLFVWTSLWFIGLWRVGPDLLVSALVYFAAAILIRIWSGDSTAWNFALLGLLLGEGYLAKAPVLPMGLIFLCICFFCVRQRRLGLSRTALAIATFALIASPYIFALSKAKGRFTFGDSAKLNYGYFVNQLPSYVHWQGGGSLGTPIHPTRQIMDTPRVYEFSGSVGGTYPGWYDPYYWHEGLVTRFDLKQQVRALGQNLAVLSWVFSSRRELLLGFLALWLASRHKFRALVYAWPLWVVSLAVFGMYSLVHLEPRFITAYFVLFWLALYGGMRFNAADVSPALIRSLMLALIVVVAVAPLKVALQNALKDLHSRPPVQWQVADALQRMGIHPGDDVASLGYTFNCYWAHLAEVRIVAETPQEDVNSFWAASSEAQAAALQAFARTGARVLVADTMPDRASYGNWRPIATTGYWYYVLDPSLKQSPVSVRAHGLTVLAAKRR
jgi:hypothetical protein